MEKNLALLGDAELALVYRHSDDEYERDLAFEELMRRYSGALRSWARSYSRSYGWLDPEDLRQEADMGFLAAVKNWDSAKSGLYGFVELCVRRRLATVIRAYFRARQVPPACVVPLFGTVSGRDADGGDDTLAIDAIADVASPDPSGLTMDEETKSELWKCAEAALSDLEFRAMRVYCEGGTYQQIAAEMGMSVKAVDNALARGKRKLREKVEHEPWRYDIA
ncbi:MAG: sigma-70 family RNA polymerase sigma factor [Dehalococcoidia bacterium]|nr:sigma-70 family RNA polymerase sigma factor [Dehalococcoidia bacterium]OPZ63754.1 MAG: RNA polymerase sigma-H factor [Firmicutes bacterium ADurb.Bin506]